MNANANLYALALRECRIQLKELALDFHPRSNSRAGIRKLRHCGIPDRLNHFAVMLLDDAPGQLVMSMYHSQPCRIAMAVKEAGRTRNVGEQHRQHIFVPTELLIDLCSRLQKLVDIIYVMGHFWVTPIVGHPIGSANGTQVTW